MKTLTPFQIENLIESLVKDELNKKEKKRRVSPLGETFIKKWKTCKTKKEKFLFFETVFSQRKKVLNEGKNHNSIDEGLMDLFSSVAGGGWSTFKEWVFSKIIKKVAELFGAEGDPELIKAISIGLANIDWTENWRKVLSPVQNCNFFANAIADSVIEYYIDKKLDEMFGDTTLGDTIRNAVVDALRDEEHVQKIQDLVISVVCKAVSTLFSGKGFGDILGKMKPSFT